MTTIRRLYLYLASFIGMSVTLAGAFILIALIVDQGFDAFRGNFIGASSGALALIMAGGAAWRFYWQTVRREAGSAADERASGTRKLYLFGTMTLALLGMLALAQQVLSELFVRLLDTGLNGYKPWTPLMIAVLLGLIWRGHSQVAEADRVAGADGTRGGDLRRGYWFVLAAYAIFTAAAGLIAFIAGLLSHLGGEPPFSSFSFGSLSQSWIQTLFPPLMQIVVSGVAIGLFWWPSQRRAAAGDETERASLARQWLVHVVVFVATAWALSGVLGVLTDILSRLLIGPVDRLLVLTINGPLASLIVGGLLLLYFFRTVRSTLPSPRLSEYLLAGVALFVGVLGVQQLVATLFRVLGGQGPRIESIITFALPPLLVGLAVWRWRWSAIEKDAAGEDGSAARSYLWRKVYLYFYHLTGLVMILTGAVIILAGVIGAILGQPLTGPFDGNVFSILADPLSLLLVGSGLLIYMMQVVNSDGRLGALSVEEVMRRTVGDSLPTWVIAAAVVFVVWPILQVLGLSLAGPIIGNIFSSIVSGID